MPPAKRRFHFIRHGESASNAGLVTDHPKTVPLTPRGHAEAAEKAALFPETPQLFITSPYDRTKQTAAPFLAKFPEVPTVEWDIHEFTYLDPGKYKGTTIAQRAYDSDMFWKRSDPHYKDSTASESFYEFIQRCRAAIAQMRALDAPFAVAFCHGFFIKGIVMCLDGRLDTVDTFGMRAFHEYHRNYTIENCAEVCFDCDDALVTLREHKAFMSAGGADYKMVD